MYLINFFILICLFIGGFRNISGLFFGGCKYIFFFLGYFFFENYSERLFCNMKVYVLFIIGIFID